MRLDTAAAKRAVQDALRLQKQGKDKEATNFLQSRVAACSDDDCRTALRTVNLIDEESRLPESAWTSWYTPAFNRREKRKESGAEGGRRSWQSRRDKRRRSDASAVPNPSVLPTGRPQTDKAGR